MRRLNLFWNKTRFVHFVQDENRHTRETLYYYQALDAFASTIREVLARIFETVRTLNKSKIFQKFLKINNNNNKKKEPWSIIWHWMWADDIRCSENREIRLYGRRTEQTNHEKTLRFIRKVNKVETRNGKWSHSLRQTWAEKYLST